MDSINSNILFGAGWISKGVLADEFRVELESLQGEIEYLQWQIEEKKKASRDFLEHLWKLHKLK